jgi:hypothetical protein
MNQCVLYITCFKDKLWKQNNDADSVCVCAVIFVGVNLTFFPQTSTTQKK